MASQSSCNKCTQQTREPHFLKCDHFFCYRCVVTLYNEHVIEQKMQTQQQGPTHFPCGVPGCRTMTPVPLGGLRNLPRSCQLTGAMADLGLGSVETTHVEDKQYKESTLKWRRGGYERILSLAVMSDGSCLVVSAAGETKCLDGLLNFSSNTLQRLNTQGEPIDLPFPCFATCPEAIGVNQTSTTVVLVDYKDDDGFQVSVYTKHGDRWQCRSFTTQRSIQDVAVTQNGGVVCTASSDLQQTLVMFTVTGQEEWSRVLPEGLYKTYMCVSENLTITSSWKTKKVSVVSRQGELLHNLPREFISLPKGVTSDSVGQVFIADQANKSISLFTYEGLFIQTLVKCQQLPCLISLSQDKFLLVQEYNQDENSEELCLYEIH